MSRACGAGGRLCEDWENYATAAITALSNLCMIPAVFVVWKQGLRFELALGLFGILASILYHVCEPTRWRVYDMNDGQWHRLDNVGAIMCFTNLFVYLMDNRDIAKNELLKYFMLCWTLLQQERGPWKLINTVLPIIGALILPIFKHAVYLRKYPEYHWRNFRIGMTLLVVSFMFFAKGLDDANDYLRLYHSGWHVFISAASYWLWRIVVFHEKKMHQQ